MEAKHSKLKAKFPFAAFITTIHPPSDPEAQFLCAVISLRLNAISYYIEIFSHIITCLYLQLIRLSGCWLLFSPV